MGATAIVAYELNGEVTEVVPISGNRLKCVIFRHVVAESTPARAS